MKIKVTLPMAKAAAIVDEALRLGRSEDMLPLTVVVLDAGGKMIAMKCEDGSGIMRHDIALGKAWGALGMGKSSRLIRDRLANRPTFQNALAAAAGGQFIPVPGGVLVVDDEGMTIGSVGISGDTSEKDEYCAVKAIQSVGFASEPEQEDPNWRASGLCDTTAAQQ